MQIRPINRYDLSSISTLHKSVFDKSYFSVYYSIKDLEMYFGSLIELNKYCYVAEIDNKIAGYLIGGEKTQLAVDKFMQQNKIKIIFYILRNPQFLLASIVKLFRKFFGRKLKSKANLRLFLIGVDPKFSRKGIGKGLIDIFEKDIQLDGFNCYGLYVRTNNLNAIIFYAKNKFHREFKYGDLYSYIKYL